LALIKEFEKSDARHGLQAALAMKYGLNTQSVGQILKEKDKQKAAFEVVRELHNGGDRLRGPTGLRGELTGLDRCATELIQRPNSTLVYCGDMHESHCNCGRTSVEGLSTSEKWMRGFNLRWGITHIKL
jgi:hypothetical protein